MVKVSYKAIYRKLKFKLKSVLLSHESFINVRARDKYKNQYKITHVRLKLFIDEITKNEENMNQIKWKNE